MWYEILAAFAIGGVCGMAIVCLLQIGSQCDDGNEVASLKAANETLQKDIESRDITIHNERAATCVLRTSVNQALAAIDDAIGKLKAEMGSRGY